MGPSRRVSYLAWEVESVAIVVPVVRFCNKTEGLLTPIGPNWDWITTLVPSRVTAPAVGLTGVGRV